MNKIKRTNFIEEKGLTLVEVLASIVILSIVLVIFLSIFIQTAKTNKTSEEIIDATYIAQTEMEKFYEFSQTVEKSERISEISSSPEYTFENDGAEKYLTTNQGYVVEIKLIEESELTQIHVKVFESNDATDPIAYMQNLVKWKDDASD